MCQSEQNGISAIPQRIEMRGLLTTYSNEAFHFDHSGYRLMVLLRSNQDRSVFSALADFYI